MANEALDYCLVVGTEEIDWLLCDAYRRWRLLRVAPPIEPFSKQNRGMILSEGAGAIVLARDGFVTIERAHPGGHFRRRAEAEKILKRILCDLRPSRNRFCYFERERDVCRSSRIPSASGGRSKCAGLYRQTRFGRKRWRCRIVADHSGSPSPAFERASAGASRGPQRPVTAFTLADADSKRATRDRFELRTQSASGRFANGDSVTRRAISLRYSLVINPAGMVDVTVEYRERSEPKVFGESACVLG